LRGKRWSGRTCGKDHGRLKVNQIGHHRGQPIIMPVRPAVFDGDVFAFDKTRFFQTALECGHERSPFCGGWATKKADHWDSPMLRARRERPRGCRAAEQGDEVAPCHSITSSARASSAGGISRLSALAVLRFITRSYLVGYCTGRSAGFSPLKMRSI